MLLMLLMFWGNYSFRFYAIFSVRITENHFHPGFVNVVNVVDPHVL